MTVRNPFAEDFDPAAEPPRRPASPPPFPPQGGGDTLTPFDDGYVAPEPEPEAVKLPLITEPGVYPDIDGDLYHSVEICDSPSISSTGLKQIENESCAHYWHDSPLNPKRPVQEQKTHFNVGKGVHDLLLLQDLFPKQYLIMPEGYDGRLARWRDAKEERAEAMRSGVPVLTADQARLVYAMAEQVERDELAKALITSGTPEMTLAARDPETGVWIRTKPDILPDTKEIIPDIKTAISLHPDAFEKAATRNGYFQSAALYLDIIEEIYGPADGKRRFVLIGVESVPPHVVQIYHLDDESIQLGRMLNRSALNKFARCLRTGVWPGYSKPESPILPLQMSAWAQAQINRRIDAGELSWEG
ncbi:UNVERIFIED_ORG: hypothetical protein M2348_001296 [Sphingomonas sp. R1F5B]